MTLLTRVSVTFLIALALALAGFSATLYYVVGLRLRLAVDQELEATLDRFGDRREAESTRVRWAIYDESNRRVEQASNVGESAVLDHVDLAPLAIDLATTVTDAKGARWRILARKFGGGWPGPRPPEGPGNRRRGGRDEHRGGPPQRERPFRVLAAWASLGPVESEIRWLGAALPLISLGLWLLAAIIGRFFGRRALAPIARMAESAREMPFDDCRLPSPGTRDELDEFASSFNGLLDRLHVALERQRQFTGQASHQLRTPLAGLVAAIEVARRRPRSTQEHEQVLDRLHGDALRLWRVVEALLFLSRADADALLPDLKDLELNSWLDDHLRRWETHERFTDIAYKHSSIRPAIARAHPELLAQLVDNLIENACKYSPPGTAITVRVRSEDSTIRLEVDDRGSGISADDLPRIFEPFFRAESVRRRGHAGVGLGLAVAHRIAESHGGTLSVSSEPGRTTFTFELPASMIQDAIEIT